MICQYCKKEFSATNKLQKFCNLKCRNTSNVKATRKRLKEKAVTYKGGKCEYCGYSKTIKALQFHHKDPTKKDFGIGENGATRAWDKIKQEIDKCLLLCANCHAEEHERLDKEE